jgi:hypothetical protein
MMQAAGSRRAQRARQRQRAGVRQRARRHAGPRHRLPQPDNGRSRDNAQPSADSADFHAPCMNKIGFFGVALLIVLGLLGSMLFVVDQRQFGVVYRWARSRK